VNAERLVVGSRGSALALVQAGWVAARLREAHPGLEVAIEKIATTGDRIHDVPLSKIGDKGLFTKELETALSDGRIDLAVHSAKDVQTALPEGLVIAAFTRRADVRDAFVGMSGTPESPSRPSGLSDLPRGAVVGSSSLRRRSQLLGLRPDLRLVDLRGNVQTRLRKLADEGLDGTVLAAAGLARLGRSDLVAFVFGLEEMLPAVGQGALAVETRAGDERVAALVACLDHEPTTLAVRAERALLAALEGGCQIPIGAHAELRDGMQDRPDDVLRDGDELLPRDGDELVSRESSELVPRSGAKLLLRAYVGSLDGTVSVRDAMTAPAGEPEALGEALAERLRAAGAERILSKLRAGGGPVPGGAR
jgi:hydroxymethylbilane synthase